MCADAEAARRSIRRTSSAGSTAPTPRCSDQYVVYTAHWDHFGKETRRTVTNLQWRRGRRPRQLLAHRDRACVQEVATPPPKRSILFLAVTAEEQGLLGSQYYAQSRSIRSQDAGRYQHGRDLQREGRTKDFTLIGLGASDLDDYLRDAARPSRAASSVPTPNRRRATTTGRTTSISPSRACPRSSTEGGVDYIGKPAGCGRAGARRVDRESDYHKPSDVVLPTWDLSGVRRGPQAALRGRIPGRQRRQVPGSGSPATNSRSIRDKSLGG